jgi:hypothetical protein
MNFYVAEETRQAEDLRQAEAYRLVRQADKVRSTGRKICCALLMGLGSKLLAWGSQMQEQMETGLNQAVMQPK